MYMYEKKLHIIWSQKLIPVELFVHTKDMQLKPKLYQQIYMVSG